MSTLTHPPRPAERSARPRPAAARQKRRPRSWAWRHRRVLFLAALLGFTGFAGALFLLMQVPLPKARPQEETTILVDVNGDRLAKLDAGTTRVKVRLDDVPRVLRLAVLATEDNAFFDHAGLDPAGILRATWADLRGVGVLQGGSTITQQYVKNVYLESRERTVARKLREAAFAIKLERRLDKEEILERYLNTVYFGRGAYGVQAAARAYFGKNVQDIGLAEASYLAGLIRSPVNADALRAPEVAAARRSRTLAAMQRAGHITAEERRQVEAVPLTSYVLPKEQAEPTFTLPDKGTQYFVEYVRRYLVQKYGEAAVYNGGLRVRTTLDLRLQSAAYDAVYGFLTPEEPAGALVALDENGYVRAMVGGRDWSASKVNLALGAAGGGSGRQPGSTFKPFVLAEAVRQGYSVLSTLPGPSSVVFPRANEGKDYPVENFDKADFAEGVTLVEATAQSVNTVYAQMIDVLGADKVADMAHDAGITSRLVPGLSLALGTSEVSVLEMAGAYTTFANRGERATPLAVLEVRTADGRIVERAEPERARVLERRHADIVNHCLQQVVRRGTGTGAAFGRPAAGKTGTTQDHGDAWFVGYTPKLTAAVWMGYPEGTSRTMSSVRGRQVTGGSFPATIWKRFMQAATKGMDTGSFPTVTSFPGKHMKPSSRVKLPTTTTTSTTTTTTVQESPTTTAPPGDKPGPTTSSPPTTAGTTTSTTTTRRPASTTTIAR